MVEKTSGRRMRWIGLLFFVALAAVVAVFAYNPKRNEPTRMYITAPVIRGDMAITVTATGNLEPRNQVVVGSELSGTVEMVAVEDNDSVVTGQLLARLDSDKIEALVSQEKAGLASAEARVMYVRASVLEAEKNLSRMQRARELSHNKTPADADVESAEAQLTRAMADEAVAKADVVRARAKIDVHETDLLKSTIRSPIRGVILKRSVEPGQTVAASLQSPVLFTLAENLTQMELHVHVDEADVGLVAPGQEVTFTVDAYPDRLFDARIIRVRYGAESTDGVVTYEAVLGVDNADGLLRPGMTATSEIVVSELKNVWLVPNTALRFSPREKKATGKASRSLLSSLLPKSSRGTKRRPVSAGGLSGKRVWVLGEDGVHPVVVKTGPTDGLRTVLESNPLGAGGGVVVGLRGNGHDAE